MNAKELFTPEDESHIKELRHALHRHAELEADLPETVRIVTGELSRLGIPYSLNYAPSGVCGFLNYGSEDPAVLEHTPGVDSPDHVYTLALRADMDALPIQEETGLPFASQNPGIMHACGHDTHTAMLLGAAKALKEAEQKQLLKVRVKLIFQPNEEGEDTGSQIMIDNGILDDVDFIYGQHASMDTPTGTLEWTKGPTMAACQTYNVCFHGKSSHATTPEQGHDAIMMAVKAVNDIYFMNAREFSPFRPRIVSVGSFHAGTAHNIIADRAELKISTRFFHEDVAELMGKRIREICGNAAAELSGTVDVEPGAQAYAVVNDEKVSELALAAARKVMDEALLREVPMRMGSEDFSCFQRVRPGAFFHIGAVNPEKGCVGTLHNSKVVLDEDMFLTGALLLTQLALDAFPGCR